LSSRATKQLSILAGVVVLLVILGGCSSLQSNTTNTLEKQIELQQAQQDLLAEPVAVETKTAEEYEAVGDRYVLQGDINRAYMFYVKGLGLEPDKAALLHKQAALLIKKNKNAEAEQVYKKLLAQNAKDPLAIEGLGKAYFGKGKSGEAEQAFLAALELRPELWQAHEYLGLISSQKKDYQWAITHFKTALTYKPGSASTTNNLAVTYYLTGDFNNAAMLLRELTAVTNDPKIHNNLGLCYFRLGDYQGALESFKKGSGSEAVAYNNLGQEYLFIEKYNEAREAFEKAIVLNPKFYPAAQKNLELSRKLSALALTPTTGK
jgi:Flp pilus assembly protein TadD